jgi:hypothetical protein
MSFSKTLQIYRVVSLCPPGHPSKAAVIRNTIKRTSCIKMASSRAVAYLGILFGGVGGGVQQIHLRTEGRENGDLGAVAP